MRGVFFLVLLAMLCLSCGADQGGDIEALQAQVESLQLRLENAEATAQRQSLEAGATADRIDPDIELAASMVLRRVERYRGLAEALALGADHGPLNAFTEALVDACTDLDGMETKPDSIRVDEIPDEYRPFLSNGTCGLVNIALNDGPMDEEGWRRLDDSVGALVRENLANISDLSAAQLAGVMQDRRDGVLRR